MPRATAPRSLAVLLVVCGLARGQDAAATLLERLTLEQRAAQLMMSWSLTRSDDGYPRRDELRHWVEDVGIGGVILSIGEVADAPALIDDLQERASIPLLCAGDFETGVAFRLRGSTEFGPAMLIGATDSTVLAREAGRMTGLESRALGFHWVFGPDLDVNDNPLNPVIHVRSFGEDPDRVGALGDAFAQGLRAAGVFACGKHFPGHGDVAVDSHLAMPTVPGDRARLDRIELAPFRRAIAGGIDTIMTGHLAVPGLGEDPKLPATLSHHILTDVLRGELGFGGVIVTDALEMKGIPRDGDEDPPLRALRAGADLLLMPLDPQIACAQIAAAVREGRLPAARLDEACLRILRLKQRAGLLDGGGLPARNAMTEIGAAGARALADSIAERGITLLRDPHGAIPLHCDVIALCEYVDGRIDEAGGSFRSVLADSCAEFSAVRLEGKLDDEAIERAAAALRLARSRGGVAILALRTRKPTLPDELAPLLDALGDDGIGVIFGNPYLSARFAPTNPLLCAYGTSEATAKAAARALRGDGPVLGRTPVALPGVAARGDGLSLLPGGTSLAHDAPALHGFAPDLATRLETRLRAAVADHVAPATVALVARHGAIVAEVAVGTETYDQGSKAVSVDSRFDMASLTKVCATTPAVLWCCDHGLLALDTPVQQLLPEFTGKDKEKVTLRHLLTHCAGLPAYIKFFETIRGKDAIVAAAAAAPLESEPGTATKYSDLGLILTMVIVERATKEPFEDFVRRVVFTPLGMAHAGFAHADHPIDAVPTEVDPWRGHLARGEVHDENAFAMGGVSGHAGLFATADDIARIGLMYLGGGRGVLRPETARTAIRRQNLVPGSSRAIGWDTFIEGGSCGSKLDASSFGHTGFTGTSIWCDPHRDLVIVLLTNRVHPSRDNQKHVALRREIADLVVDAMQDG